MPGSAYSTAIVRRQMQRRFNLHRGKLDAHRNRGPAFAAAVEALEKALFIPPADEEAPPQNPDEGA